MATFIYSVPAMLALLAKFGILYCSRTAKVQNAQTRLLFFVLLFSLGLSAAEVLFLNRVFADPPTAAVFAYFAISIVSMAITLHLTMSVSFDAWNTPRFYPIYVFLYGYAAVLEILLLFTPWIVTGIEPFRDYSFTRIPGPLYWLYEVFIVFGFVAILALSIFGLRGSRSTIATNRCKLWLVAIAPMALLVITIVVLLHLKIRWFNSTVTLPLAFTFFCAVITYAIHNYRLFEIEFLIPWSKTRKRKSAFYDRIRTMVAEIADLDSVGGAVNRLADTLRCPVALIGGPEPALAMAGHTKVMIQIPIRELRRIEHIVVTHEIVDATPQTHALLKQHGIAAVVPFFPNSRTAASWMLLGESFSEQVYTPLDFKMVEQLFDRLGDLFLDKLLSLRAQLHLVRDQMQTLQLRLDAAQQDSQEVRHENGLLRRRLTELEREESAGGNSNQTAQVLMLVANPAREEKPLVQQVLDHERRLIVRALKRCHGSSAKAARLLGMSLPGLREKLELHGLKASLRD